MSDKTIMLEKITEAAEYIRGIFGDAPDTAIVLGTGLGSFAEGLASSKIINYSDIPHFPVSTAPDHAGRLIAAVISGKPVLIMQGRIHFYEGYSMDEVTFPIRVMKLLGIKNLILTNAAGAINTDFHTGELMLISDHIKFFSDTPLRGKNLDSFGPRFNDMSDTYCEEYRAMIKSFAQENDILLREGVYSYMPGPCFETPAEIRMLRILGADAVGMSTVPEAICAAHAGIKVVGISFLTNMAAGINKKIEDLQFTEDSKKSLAKLITGFIAKL